MLATTESVVTLTCKCTLHPRHLKHTHSFRGRGSWGPGARPQSLLPKGFVLGEVAGQLHEWVGTPTFALHQLPHCHGDHHLSDGHRTGTEVPKPDLPQATTQPLPRGGGQMIVPRGPGRRPRAPSVRSLWLRPASPRPGGERAPPRETGPRGEWAPYRPAAAPTKRACNPEPLHRLDGDPAGQGTAEMQPIEPGPLRPSAGRQRASPRHLSPSPARLSRPRFPTTDHPNTAGRRPLPCPGPDRPPRVRGARLLSRPGPCAHPRAPRCTACGGTWRA